MWTYNYLKTINQKKINKNEKALQITPPVGHLSGSHWQWHANDHDQRVDETSSTSQPASTSWHHGYTCLALLGDAAFILPSMSKLSSYWSPTAKFSFLAGGIPCGSMVKNSPAMWETEVRSLGQEDPLEEKMAIHSSIPARKIPLTEKPGRLQSMGSQRVGHDWATKHHHHHHHYLCWRQCHSHSCPGSKLWPLLSFFKLFFYMQKSSPRKLFYKMSPDFHQFLLQFLARPHYLRALIACWAPSSLSLSISSPTTSILQTQCYFSSSYCPNEKRWVTSPVCVCVCVFICCGSGEHGSLRCIRTYVCVCMCVCERGLWPELPLTQV